MVLTSNYSIYYLHLSKNGGTTLCDMARSHYNIKVLAIWNCNLPDNVIDANREGTNAAAQRAIFRRYRELRFFANEGLMAPQGQELFGGPFAYVVILRHPFSRAASRFAYHLKYNKQQRALFPTLSKFLEAKWDNLDYSQVHALSGFRGPREDLNSTHLEIAKNRLKHFSVVFTLDRFKEGIKLMEHKFGWFKTYFLRKNTSPTRAEFTAEEEEKMTRMFHLDLELYDFADKLLSVQVDCMWTEKNLTAQGVAGYEAALPLGIPVKQGSRLCHCKTQMEFRTTRAPKGHFGL
ncbi:hypothetical protein CYMTET_25654 [Cymbomonas tetramitiformis]|uniref:Uncharacterized protein n=1 Tax=Cymbomonas tetramitiformis TaxID=36881 RepID=A0AAE0KYU1_9CHLO|nr:hypothetical protein CYMTET_25654 [Cymbomonas tetramitiformis]